MLTSAALFLALAASNSDSELKCNKEPQVVTVATPYYPDADLNLGQLKVLVLVTIDANGELADATIYSSSGYDDFDGAAIWAARKSKFSPGLRDCQPATSKAIFAAEFNPSNINGVHSTRFIPNFSPGSDWNVDGDDKHPDLVLSSLGYVVNKWRRDDETLALAEYSADGADVSPDRALAFVRSRLERTMDLSDENIATTSLCNGKLPAREISFHFVLTVNGEFKVSREGEVFLAATHDTVYSLGYTMPPDAPLDTVVPPEIAGFCG